MCAETVDKLWPSAEVAHARQTPSELGLHSLNRYFEN